MKIKNFFAGALALGFTSSAFAQTEILVTGATAFRQATMQGIYDAFASEGALGTSFNVAHDFTGNNLSQLIASNKAIFSGKFPNISGTTIVRTAFNGSVEGLNAIVGKNNPTFLTTVALGTPGPVIKGATTAPTSAARPKFSFSDIFQSSTPVQTDLNNDDITLNPAGSSAVGVVTFAMITNEGAPANFTNVTQQQASALFGAGFLPLSTFTGNNSQTGIDVFATGRNDGSGTRGAYLTEWQKGVSNPVQQYITTVSGTTGNDITSITRVPANGIGTGPATVNSAYSANATTILVNGPIANLATGRRITGTGITANTTVTAFTGNSTVTLTLSAATTGAGAANSIVNITGIGNFATSGTANASTLWGITAVGNGGFSSSSALRTVMGLASGSVNVFNGTSQTAIFTNKNLLLLTFLSTSDSRDAAAAGGRILSYNGVSITPLVAADPNNFNGTGFNEVDFRKITRGAYSAWSYQHLYYWGSLSANEQLWYDTMVGPGNYIEDGLQTTANGVRLSDMQAERADDGFPITSL